MPERRLQPQTVYSVKNSLHILRICWIGPEVLIVLVFLGDCCFLALVFGGLGSGGLESVGGESLWNECQVVCRR